MRGSGDWSASDVDFVRRNRSLCIAKQTCVRRTLRTNVVREVSPAVFHHPGDVTTNLGGLMMRNRIRNYEPSRSFATHELTDAERAALAGRFAAMTVRDDATGCLLFIGPKSVGYGKIPMGRGRARHAHRVAWELAHGPIPKGMLVCHRCDNPPCCDVSHLFLGTVKDNADDMVAKGRSAAGVRHGLVRHPERRPRGEGHGCSKLNAEDVREARRRYSSGASFCALGRDFGRSEATMRDAVTGVTWANVTEPGPVATHGHLHRVARKRAA